MKKLTKIFSINVKVNGMKELVKKINGKITFVPFYNNEIKVIGNDIYVTEEAFNTHIKFFRTLFC